MEIVKLKEKYERELKILEYDVLAYESSNNHELRIAAISWKREAEELRIVVDALGKQTLMMAYVDEYDDEFVCPSCGETIEHYDVTTLKVCPECGQKLKWG
ncbi:MAG: hypothetical protein LLG05_18955 [Porphyromonadaceae bacterium]|nr:hypothetical protein [Porphyromonadaceae bacterium]